MTQRAIAFRAREQAILNAAEYLLLELGDETITIEMIAERVGIAKGTIYKHFQSKDELILQLLIAYETELATTLFEAAKSNDLAQIIQAYFSFRLATPEKHLLFERLENKLAATRRTLRPYFARLYFIRKSYLRQMLPFVTQHLQQQNSPMTARDYLTAGWALVQGTAAILHSSFYQRYLGDRQGLLAALLQSLLALGNQHYDTPVSTLKE
ncbi:TetR/AcrR family transcriptional regulator [Agitococcus lubricus]|uniref:TetR family transcriptional regulator n=1 Tax=Agitococcus lubricus TaxID=1077255 RepID=A0A2T5IZ93_9GAMM|nr:TetR/AcrR family transcriptional regulator [Agitococcus lubricus]PTQ89363.1 TetR family transcriptional regulator [Agitococcus lubricus]